MGEAKELLSDITFLGQALTLRNAQLGLETANLANASTPGYKATSLNFQRALSDVLTKKLAPQDAVARNIQYERDNPVGLNGNSVNSQQAMVQLTQTALASESDETFTQDSVTAMLDAIATSATY